MSLKIRLKNLGILKHAEFSLGDLTLICGKNNTGKTYVAYALYAFLNAWRGLTEFGVNSTQIQRLLTDGGIKIGLGGYAEKADQLLAEACKRYTNQLDEVVFASTEGRFHNSDFHIEVEAIDIRNKEFKRELGIAQERFLRYSKEQGSEELTVSLVVQRDQEREIDPFFTERSVNFIIGQCYFFRFFAYSFYCFSRAHRTRYFPEGTQFCSESLT